MRTTLAVIAATSLIGLLFGCATVQPINTAAAAAAVEHHSDRNYAIGIQQSVYVGQAMVRVKDYYTDQVSGIARPDRAFTLKLPPFMRVNVAAGEAMQFVGTTQRAGKTYRVVKIQQPAAAALGFLLNDDGTFEGSAVNVAGARMGFSYKPDPSGTRVLPDKDISVVVGRGVTNFELIYGGTTGDSIQVMYREYTPEDMARPAFSQQLVYSLASKAIRFRDIQIHVDGADNEKITYTVLADGQ